MPEKHFYLDLNLNDNELKSVVIENLSVNPGSSKSGKIYYNIPNKILKYYDGSGWKPIGADKLDDLSDVDPIPVSDIGLNNQYLVYNGSNKKWEPGILKAKIGDLADVNALGVADQQVLTYDAASNHWIPKEPIGGLGINDPVDGRLVISGGVGGNLKTDENLVWDGNALRLSGSGVTGVFKIGVNDPVVSGSTYGIFGFDSHLGGAYDINASIQIRASENHTTTHQGNIMTFETTNTGQSTRSADLMISGSGNVIANPQSELEDHPKSTFRINGSLSTMTRLYNTAGAYDLDDGFLDSVIICTVGGNGQIFIHFPPASVEHEGRRVTCKLLSSTSGGMALDSSKFCVKSSIPISRVAVTEPGASVELVCARITSALYAWVVVSEIHVSAI